MVQGLSTVTTVLLSVVFAFVFALIVYASDCFAYAASIQNYRESRMAAAQHTVFYALIMLAVGLGIPMFAALNGGLASRLQNPMLASTVALLAAIVIIVGALLMTEGVPRVSFDRSIPIWFYFGGVFVAIYILGMTWIAPRFGVGNAVAFVLLGQLISMALIDHFGWFGAAQYPLSLQRLAGLGLMTVGVFLAVRH